MSEAADFDRYHKSQGSGGDDDTIADAVIVAILGVFILLPSIVALGLYVGLAKHLRRFEFMLIGVFGVAGLALSASWAFRDYLRWMWSLVPGGPPAQVLPPILPILLLALPLASVLGMIAGSRYANKLPGPKVRRFLKARNPLDVESVLPSENERARALRTGPPGGLVVDTHSHSLTEQHGEHGKRFIPLGIDKNGEVAGVTEFELGMHMLVMGSTGSGKSETLKSLSAGLMDLGWHGVVLDLKEAGDLEEYFEEYCLHHSLPYQSLMLSDSSPDVWFNPMFGMRADSALDALMMTQNYGANASYYEAINRKAAGQLLNLLYDAHEVDPTQFAYPTINEMGRMLAHGPKLPSAVKRHVAAVIANNPARTKDDYLALLKPDKDQADAASGLGTRLTNMLDTSAGRVILRPDPEKRPLDVSADGLTYIGLDTQGRPEMSQIMAGFVLQRIAVMAAQRTIEKQRGAKPRPRFLMIDEANQVTARPIILTLLQKARAAGITVILATQSPTDWQDELGDDWDSMAQNCNAAVIMSQGARGPAEMCAELIGMRRFFQAGLEYADGDLYDSGRLMEREDYLVNPDQLRQLGIGEAIIRVGKPRERVQWLQVKMRDATRHAGQSGPAAGPSGTGGSGGMHGTLPTLGGDLPGMRQQSQGPTVLGGDGSVGSSMPDPKR